MVKVNREKCVGCSACVGANPEVFEMKDRKASVIAGQEENESGKDTIEVCPVGAIE